MKINFPFPVKPIEWDTDNTLIYKSGLKAEIPSAA